MTEGSLNPNETGDFADASGELEVPLNYSKDKREADTSFKTHYNEFLHPNVEDADENTATGCMSCWDRFDDKYVRPFLVYKYDRIKYRPEFEIEDVLNEYRVIEEELNTENPVMDATLRDITLRKESALTRQVDG